MTRKEGPDFDYTFEVVPDSSSDAELVDAWNLLGKEAHMPVLAPGAGANDVAEDEPTFRQLFEKARVILTPFWFTVVHREPDPATGQPVNPGPDTIFRDEIVDIKMSKFPNNNQDRTVTLSIVEEAMRTENLPNRGNVQMYDFGSINVGDAVKPGQTEFILKATDAGKTRIKAVFNKAGKLKIKAVLSDQQIPYISKEFTIKERIRKYSTPFVGFAKHDPNKYDQDFVDAATDWGNFYSYPIDTVDRIKAMGVAESSMGARPTAPIDRPHDILSVGNPGDHVLVTIRGTDPEHLQWDLDLVHPKKPAADPRYKKLNYLTAGVATPREAIYWGVLWFYVKGFAFEDNIVRNAAHEWDKRNLAPLDVIDGIEEPEWKFNNWSNFEIMTARYNANPAINYPDRVNKALLSGIHFNAAVGNNKMWPIRSDKSARP